MIYAIVGGGFYRILYVTCPIERIVGGMHVNAHEGGMYACRVQRSGSVGPGHFGGPGRAVPV